MQDTADALLIDVHQHVWSEPLVQALASRRELPFVRREHGLTVLFSSGEQPYVIDPAGEQPQRRAALVRRDRVDRALVALSSPLGIELLPRAQARELIDAYYDGALALGERFGVWGAIALDRLDAEDVEDALERGCVGISLPAGALGSLERFAAVAPALARLQAHGASLFVHPGRGTRHPGHEAALGDPLWWPAMTRSIVEAQAAWLQFVTVGRRLFPRLRVVFAMLAGLAPLQAERLAARGGPPLDLRDPLIYYDASSYGPSATGQLGAVVGEQQILYGSDRPLAGDSLQGLDRDGLSWRCYAANAECLLRPAEASADRRSARRVATLARAV